MALSGQVHSQRPKPFPQTWNWDLEFLSELLSFLPITTSSEYIWEERVILLVSLAGLETSAFKFPPAPSSPLNCAAFLKRTGSLLQPSILLQLSEFSVMAFCMGGTSLTLQICTSSKASFPSTTGCFGWTVTVTALLGCLRALSINFSKASSATDTGSALRAARWL